MVERTMASNGLISSDVYYHFGNVGSSLMKTVLQWQSKCINCFCSKVRYEMCSLSDPMSCCYCNYV